MTEKEKLKALEVLDELLSEDENFYENDSQL